MSSSSSSSPLSLVAQLLLAAALLASPAALAAAAPRSSELGLAPTQAVYTTPYVDGAALREEQEQMAANRTAEPGPYMFGVPLEMNDLDVLAAGSAEEVDDGTVYRLRIDSKGAVLMQIAFSRLELQGGSQMFIYEAGKSEPHFVSYR